MNFEECVMKCFDEKELVRQFNRLYGCSLGEDRRQTIELMIDKATGNEPPPIDEEDARKFIRFVWNCIWLPLVSPTSP